jgi:hypothetical protein
LAILAALAACGGGGKAGGGSAGAKGGSGGALGGPGGSTASAGAGGGGGKAGGGGTGTAGRAGTSGGAGAAGGMASAGAGGGAGRADAGAASDGAVGADGAAARAPFDLSRVDCLVKGDGKTSVALVNHCRAHVTFAGSQNQTGELDPDQFQCRDVGNATDNLPAIRYWGFTAPDPGLGRHTLAEFTFNTSFNNFDWYNISHVDAENLPMQIAAHAMPSCRTLTCAESLLADCPAVGQYKDAAGDVTACVSPDPNNPQSPVAQYFDKACPDAYSWSGDDANSVVACAGEDYVVTFCP